jgi:hypothetical protein
MIIIYRTNYEFCGSTYVLCFSLSESICRQMDEWEAVLDRMVFEEQIMRGSFRGGYSIDDSQRILMEQMREKGIIQPYYGAINASACTHTLQVLPPTCVVSSEHTVVEETKIFEDAVTILEADGSVVAQNHKRGFMIERQEYRSLQQWKFWNAEDEFTGRYIFGFAPTAIGTAIKVTDTRSRQEIDITDWSDW